MTQADSQQRAGPFGLAERFLYWAGLFPDGIVTIMARLSVAAIFWRSGETKLDGWHLSDTAVQLFQEEYKVPLLPPEIAASMAAFAEHLFPIMLVIGLGARLGALGLLGMTLVIEVFVYPDAWPIHGVWAVALLFVITRGPGILSLDHLIRRRFLG